MSMGDARRALNAIELAVLTSQMDKDGYTNIDLETAKESMQKKHHRYDKSGDYHYDVISAFIKSMRGSDPDATLHYLARMIESGEDVMFIMRRIVICASEDVGNADPQALILATSAMNAVHSIGFPEATFILSQAALYVACAPKSNSSGGVFAAIDDVRNLEIDKIPPYLRDSHYKGAKKLGHGIGYKYPHSYENHYVEQEYLPESIKDKKYYLPGDMGYEKEIKQYLENLKKEK